MGKTGCPSCKLPVLVLPSQVLHHTCGLEVNSPDVVLLYFVVSCITVHYTLVNSRIVSCCILLFCIVWCFHVVECIVFCEDFYVLILGSIKYNY